MGGDRSRPPALTIGFIVIAARAIIPAALGEQLFTR
jgi:hypothetical protein